MNIHQISELILKTIGILCFVYAVSHLGYYSSYFFVEQMPPKEIIVSSGIGPIIGPIVIGITLFVNAKNWGHKLVSNSNNDTSTTKITATEWHSILVSVLGLFLLATTIVPLVNNIVAVIRIHNQSGYGGIPVSAITWLIGYILTMAVGLWFALGARGIVGAILKLRYAGS